MIRSARGLLLVAVVTLVIGLVVLFPARIAYRWIAPAPIAMTGLHGSVWSGGATAATVSGAYLQDLSWRFRPLRLFTGKVAYRVEATPVSGFMEGNIGFGIGGRVSISDLVASLPLQMFASSFNIRGLQGSASLQFEIIKLEDSLPVAANGTVEVSNLAAPAISRESIGGYRAEFFTQDGGIAASVEDTDGRVDIAGSLQVNEDRSYQFIAQLAAKPDAPADLRRQLQYLPPANDRGQQELRIEGSL